MAAGKRDGKAVANLVMGDISAYANSQGSRCYETHITPAQIAGIVDLVAGGHDFVQDRQGPAAGHHHRGARGRSGRDRRARAA